MDFISIVLLDDILDHSNEMKELSYSEDPDINQVEYHHERLVRKVGLLKGYLKGKPNGGEVESWKPVSLPISSLSDRV